MIYLMSPFWHDKKSIREERVHQAILLTRALMRAGKPIFSPIAHSNILNTHRDLERMPFTNDEWVSFDLQYIKCCTEAFFMKINGWELSNGMAREKEFCISKHIPLVEYSPSACAALIESELLVGMKA